MSENVQNNGEGTKTKEIGTVSKYMCVVNKPLHFIVMSLYTVIFLYIAIHMSVNNLWYLYMGSTITVVIAFVSMYKYCYSRKVKADKLNLHKISLARRVIFIAVTLIIMSIISCIGGVIQVYFMMQGMM